MIDSRKDSAITENRSSPGHRLGANVVAQRLDAALYARQLSLRIDRAGITRCFILLTGGAGEILGGKEPMLLSAPALAWLPVETGHHLSIAAGTQGHIVWLSDQLANNALGDHAESAQLRNLIDRPVVANRFDKPGIVAELEHCLAAIERETRESEGGSWVYLSAQIALILVHCWRLSGLEEVSRQGHSTNSTTLLKFRNLVEIHFRDHWTISQYANALGIAHDRLHDVCKRSLSRTPLQLVHERLAHEATRRLVRSGFTIEQVSADLGFKTTTYFSRFFSREIGMSPGRYRTEAANSRPNLSQLSSDSYADWP